MADSPEVRRVAAAADLHYSAHTDPAPLRTLLDQVAEQADVLLLCGDLTDHGRPEEAKCLAQQLAMVRTPLLAVLGNHDHESGEADQLAKILSDAGVNVLDGDACVLGDVGFAGVKGFGGGFGRRALAAWGEPAIKAFVQEVMDETMKLETALVRLDTPHRIVLLHYAPIEATVDGEPRELFPFLGSSHLEEPINRYGVQAVFHGHAHHGAPEGKTQTGIAVYNVSTRVLEAAFPQQAPFRVHVVA
jgi:Icc-related predicted phosphoesterase